MTSPAFIFSPSRSDGSLPALCCGVKQTRSSTKVKATPSDSKPVTLLYTTIVSSRSRKNLTKNLSVLPDGVKPDHNKANRTQTTLRMNSDQSLTTSTASMKLSCDTLNVVKNKTPATYERPPLKLETSFFYLKNPFYLSRTFTTLSTTRKQVELQKKNSSNQLNSKNLTVNFQAPIKIRPGSKKSTLEVAISKSLPTWIKADTINAENVQLSSSKPTLTFPKQSTTLSSKLVDTPGNNEVSIASDVKLSSNSGTKKITIDGISFGNDQNLYAFASSLDKTKLSDNPVEFTTTSSETQRMLSSSLSFQSKTTREVLNASAAPGKNMFTAEATSPETSHITTLKHGELTILTQAKLPLKTILGRKFLSEAPKMTTSQIAIKDNNATIVHSGMFGSTKMSTAGLMISKSRASELSQTTYPENATAVTKKSMITVSPQTTPKKLTAARMAAYGENDISKMISTETTASGYTSSQKPELEILTRETTSATRQTKRSTVSNESFFKEKAYSKVPKTVATDSTPKIINESPITVAIVFEKVSHKLSAVRLTTFEIQSLKYTTSQSHLDFVFTGEPVSTIAANKFTSSQSSKFSPTTKIMSTKSTKFSPTPKFSPTQATTFSPTFEITSTQSTKISPTNKFTSTQSTKLFLTNKFSSTQSAKVSPTNKIRSTQSTKDSATNKFTSTQSTKHSPTSKVTPTQSTKDSPTNKFTSTQSAKLFLTNQFKYSQSTKFSPTDKFTSTQSTKHSPTIKVTPTQSTKDSPTNEFTSTQSTKLFLTNQFKSSQSTKFSPTDKFTPTQSTKHSPTNKFTSTQSTKLFLTNKFSSTQSTKFSPTDKFTPTQSTKHSPTNKVTPTQSTKDSPTNKFTSTQSTKLFLTNQFKSSQSTKFSPTDKFTPTQSTKHSPINKVTTTQSTKDSPTNEFTSTQSTKLFLTNQFSSTQSAKISPTNKIISTQSTKDSATKKFTSTQSTKHSPTNNFTPTQSKKDSPTNKFTSTQSTKLFLTNQFKSSQSTKFSPTDKFTPTQSTKHSPTNKVTTTQSTKDSPTNEFTSTQSTKLFLTNQFKSSQSTEFSPTDKFTPTQSTKVSVKTKFRTTQSRKISLTNKFKTTQITNFSAANKFTHTQTANDKFTSTQSTKLSPTDKLTDTQSTKISPAIKFRPAQTTIIFPTNEFKSTQSTQSFEPITFKYFSPINKKATVATSSKSSPFPTPNQYSTSKQFSSDVFESKSKTSIEPKLRPTSIKLESNISKKSNTALKISKDDFELASINENWNQTRTKSTPGKHHGLTFTQKNACHKVQYI